ncbi:hypothetical protein ACIQU4_15505 [Streptomyces sp. NPDC090741]|uniref:hypothetical protein n=1 Tax=Streptomyces sp. NPDC090741 TaxID=3365967 RepID=UPI00382987A9
MDECLLCGAPGGHPYCNAACEAADQPTNEGTNPMPEQPTPATIIAQPEVSQAVYQQITNGGTPGGPAGMADTLANAHSNASNQK